MNLRDKIALEVMKNTLTAQGRNGETTRAEGDDPDAQAALQAYMEEVAYSAYAMADVMIRVRGE